MVKNPSTMQETWVQFPGQEDLPLEKGMATHSGILAWRIPWTEEPGGYSSWGCKESDMTKQITQPAAVRRSSLTLMARSPIPAYLVLDASESTHQPHCPVLA